ncbi:putative harbinger transposase-derived nuclease [Abeliophyllum distichum]|uniref:Harbinger transposase-derived nuclease n=1 Tax=Abeliophyllum distichum TaxID=126358 RepID=A0ABD1TFU9_9LAMI
MGTRKSTPVKPVSPAKKNAKWAKREHQIFLTACETVIAEGHRRGKCFSKHGWERLVNLFNNSAAKSWRRKAEYAKFRNRDVREIYHRYPSCLDKLSTQTNNVALEVDSTRDFKVKEQNVLAACDFNLCFTFVLPVNTENTHDSRILARAIYSPDINSLEPRPGKYYLVDSGFANRPGYLAPYKVSDIRYHFQEFRESMGGHSRRFKNAKERFNFNHSSCRNVIKRVFGVLKIHWKMLDRMPSYFIPAQTAVVVATMTVHNFLRRLGGIDQGFDSVESNRNHDEIDMPDEQDQIAAEMNAPQN